MLEGIRDLLTNLLFVLLPLFFIQLFWLDRPNLQKNPGWIAIGFAGGIAAILCMTFPISVTDGFQMDLRQVPLVMVFLYRGYKSGLLTCLFLVSYRFYLGGTGVYGNLATTLILLLILAAVAPRFRQYKVFTRASLTAFIALLAVAFGTVVTLILYPDIFHNPTYQQYILLYALLQLVGSWLGAYCVEMTIRNMEMRVMLEQSKKMQLVSELAASVSHEVRNPLTVTRGFIQLLRKENLPQDKRDGFIQLALEELDRAESIISDYLSFAKPQIGKPEALCMRQELQYVSDVITPFAAMNQVHVRLLLNEDCLIQGERDKFRQCMVNLAKNAIEAMPEGGTLEIMVNRKAGTAEIRLLDTGIGMSEEQIQRLGTPYYSTKDKGTGLGTMIVYSLVKAMGGKIKVWSKLGEGTCFTLTFPCT